MELSADQRQLSEAICRAIRVELRSAWQELGAPDEDRGGCGRCAEWEKALADARNELGVAKEAAAHSLGKFEASQDNLRVYMDKLDEERFERKAIQLQLEKANTELATVRREIHLANLKLEKSSSGKGKKDKSAFRDVIDRLELASKACEPNGQKKPRAAEMKRLEEDLTFIMTAGMLAPVVQALLLGTMAVKEAAIKALLQHLRWAGEYSCRGSAEVILSSGAVNVVIKMLSEKEGSAEAASAAVMALDLLATAHEDACRVIASDGAIALLVGLLKTGDVLACEASVRLLLKLCSVDTKHCGAVGLAGGISDLLGLISLPAALEHRALCTLTCELLCHMAVANPLSRGAIAEAGGLSPLVVLLKSGEAELACAAAAVLGPVAEAADACAELLDIGIVAPLAGMLTSCREAAAEAASLALANLSAGTAGKRDAASSMLDEEVLATVVDALVSCSSPRTLRSCAAMLGHLAALGAEERARVVAANAALALVQAVKVLVPRAARDPDPSLPPGHSRTDTLLAAAAAAATALGSLFADAATRDEVLATNPGLLLALLRLVAARPSTPAAAQVATMIGASLAESHAQEAVDAGAVGALVAALESGVCANQRAAACTLRVLDASLPVFIMADTVGGVGEGETDESALIGARLQFTGRVIPGIIGALAGGEVDSWARDKATVVAGQTLLGTLKQLLKHEVDAVLAADVGGIPVVVRFLRMGGGLGACAAVTLAALFELLPQHNDHMLDAIPVLVGLLLQERPCEHELVVIGILKRASKFPSCVGVIVEEGAVPALLSRMGDENVPAELQASAAATLADVVRQAPLPSDGKLGPLVEASALAALNNLLAAGSSAVRAAAAKLLWQLAYQNYGADIAASGAIPGLLKLLQDEDDEAVHNAVEAIVNLTDDGTRASIVSAGTIDHLIPLLSSVSPDVVLAAVTALDALAVMPESIESITALGGVQMLVDLLRVDDSPRGRDICYHAAFALAKAASNMNVKQLLVDVGGVDNIVLLVNEAVSMLVEFPRVASDGKQDSEGASAAAPHVVRSHSAKEPVWGAAIHVLQSLAQGWNAIQNLMFASGMVQQLLHLLRHGGSSLQEAVAGVIVSLTDGEGSEDADEVARGHKQALLELGAVEPLVAMLVGEGSSGRERDLAATALAQFCSESSVRAMLRDMGGLAALVSMLGEVSEDGGDEQRAAALGVICELAQHEDSMALVLSAGAIPVLVELLSSGPPHAGRAAEAMYLLSADYACCLEIAEEGGTTHLLDLLCRGADGCIPAGLAIVRLAGHKEVGPRLCTPAIIAQLTAQMAAAPEEQPVPGTAGLTILGLSEHVDKHGALLESVVPPLLASLKGGADVEMMELAILTLVRLAVTQIGRAEIHGAGGTELVCGILQSGGSEEALRVGAALATCNLVLHPDARDVMLDSLDGICAGLLGLLPQLEANSNDGSVAAGDTLIRLLDGEDVMDAEHKYGLLSTLVGLLQAESKTLQQTAAGCLAMFCEADEAGREYVLRQGGAPLVRALVEALQIACRGTDVFEVLACQLAGRWEGYRQQFDSTWVPAVAEEGVPYITSPLVAADLLQSLLLDSDPSYAASVAGMGGISTLLDLLCVRLIDCPELNRCHILDTLLSLLAKETGYCKTILAAQGVVMLTEMLSDPVNWESFSAVEGAELGGGGSATQIPELAGLLLWKLSVCDVDTFVADFGGAGGIEVVDRLLGTDSPKLRKIGLELLGLLVSTPHNNRSDVFRHLGVYRHLLAAIQQADDAKESPPSASPAAAQLRGLAISVLRRMARDRDGCEEIAAADVIPVLVGLLDSSDPGTQGECAQALRQIAEMQAMAVYIAGAVEKLSEQLGTADAQSRALAAAALLPLASLDKARAAIRAADAVPALVALVGDVDVHCRTSAALVLQALGEYEEFRALIADSGGLGALAKVLEAEDVEESNQGDKLAAAHALQSLIFDCPENAKVLVDGGVHHQLLKLLEQGVENEDMHAQAAAGVALLNLAQVEEDVRAELAEVDGAMDVIVGVLDEACRDVSLGKEGEKAIEAQEAAAGLISMFAEDDDTMADIIGQTDRTIGSLVQLLSTENNGARRAAAWALRHLASSDANRAAMAEAGAIGPLVSLLEIPSSSSVGRPSMDGGLAEGVVEHERPPSVIDSGDDGTNDDAPTAAAGALQILAMDDGCSNQIADAGGIPLLVRCLLQGSDFCKIVAAGALGTLAYNVENRKAIVSEGAIPALVALLGADNGEEGQESAAVALANLMTGDESRCLAVDAGAVLPLVGMLENGPPETQEAAAQALGGLAKSVMGRDAIADAGGVCALVRALRVGERSVQEEAARAMHNLSAEPASQAGGLIAENAVEALVALLQEEAREEEEEEDVEALHDAQRAACQALCSLSSFSGAAEGLLSAGGVPVVVQALRPGAFPASIQALAAQVLAECGSSSIEVATAMLDSQAAQPLLRLLGGSNDACQLAAARALLCLAGTPGGAGAALEGGAVQLALATLSETTGSGGGSGIRGGALPAAALRVLGALCRSGTAGQQASILGEAGLTRIGGMLAPVEDAACASAASKILADLLGDDASCLSANGLLLVLLEYVCVHGAAHLPGGAAEASSLLRAAAAASPSALEGVGGIVPLVRALQLGGETSRTQHAQDKLNSSEYPGDLLLVAAAEGLSAVCRAGGCADVLAAGGAQALVDLLLPSARTVLPAALHALELLSTCVDPAGVQALIEAGARAALHRLLLVEQGNEAEALASRLLARLSQGLTESPSATDLVDVENLRPVPLTPDLGALELQRRNRGGPNSGRPVRFSLDTARSNNAVGTPPRAPLVSEDATSVVEEPSEDDASIAHLRLRRVSSPFASRQSEDSTGSTIDTGRSNSSGLRRSRSDSLDNLINDSDMRRMSSTGPVEEPQDGA